MHQTLAQRLAPVAGASGGNDWSLDPWNQDCKWRSRLNLAVATACTLLVSKEANLAGLWGVDDELSTRRRTV